MHISGRREKMLLKWKQGTDGAGEVGKKRPGGCKDRILQGMQKLTAPGATMDKTKGNKMFLQGKTAVGESIKTSIKTLMAIAWVEFGMPPPPTKKKKKISYTEEETSPRGVAGCRLTFEFKREISGDIREKLPVPFQWHVMQQAIDLEKEHRLNIGYSEYKIRRSRYRVDVKFMKYSGLHAMAAEHEDHWYEEGDGFIFE